MGHSAADMIAETARIQATTRSLALITMGRKYKTLLIDPPWPSASKKARGHWLSDNTKPRYDTMSYRELKYLPVYEITQADSMLVMWTTWMHLPLSFQLINDWGFQYATGMPWLKTVQRDRIEDDPFLSQSMSIALKRRILKPIFGPGVWFQHCTEIVLLARRGRPFGKQGNPRPARPGIIISPRGEHSAKPQELHDWIDEKFPGPKIELFARAQRPGWTCWGDQVEHNVKPAGR